MRTPTARPASPRRGSRHLAHRSSGSRARAPHGAHVPPIVTVFRDAHGELHHGWCGRALEYLGRRERLELDFYCPQCFEHVTIPECTLTRIPTSAPAATMAGLVPMAAVGDWSRRIGTATEFFDERRPAA